MRSVLRAAAALLLTAVPACADSDTMLKGVDLYRSSTLTIERVREALGTTLASFAQARADHKKSSRKAAARLKAQIEAKIRTLAPLAYVDLSYQEYVTSAERSSYITFDVVDPADAKQRMPFDPAPAGKALDPEGLLTIWQKYYDLGDSLARQGLSPTTERPACPGFFCFWGARNSELAQLDQKLADGATPNHRLLREVLKKEADAKKRAAAVYVLAYMKDGNAVIDAALSALRDPEPEVRAAALQVLAEMATYYRIYAMDVDKVVAALDYPTVSDRARALAVLVGLSENPAYREKVMVKATPYLLALLKLSQPSNHDLAFTLLATLSQESHDRRDYKSWAAWVETKASSSTATIPGSASGDVP